MKGFGVLSLILIFFPLNIFAKCVTSSEEVLAEKLNSFRLTNQKSILPLVMNTGKKNEKLEIKFNNNNLDKISRLFYRYQNLKVILERSEYSKRKWIALNLKLTKNKLIIYFIEKADKFEKAIICSNKKMYNLENKASSNIYSVKHSFYDTEQYSWVIKPQYEQIDSEGSFSEGLIAVKNDSYKWGFIDENGKTVIGFTFNKAKNFKNGYALVNNSYFIDKKGKKLKFDNLKIIYSYKNSFLVKDKNYLMFFIDQKGKILSEKYSDIGWFSEGEVVYLTKNKKKRSVYGFLNESFKPEIEAKYSDAFAFSEGMAGVKYRGKWGFIDKSGKMTIKPKYKKKIVYQFKEGFAVVPIGKKSGYIDKTGKLKIKAKYDEAWGFSKDGLAAVRKGKKWGFIDKSGKLIIPIKYTAVGYFSDGLAKVRVGEIIGNRGAWGFIDKTGKFIITPQFSKVKDYKNGIIAVKYGSLWGFIKLK